MRKIIPCIIGLGYVGLPIFIRLQRKFKTIGFDIDQNRIFSLNKGIDSNNEFSSQFLQKKKLSVFTNKIKDLHQCNFFIIAVPTPIFSNKKPNLNPLIVATKLISKIIKKNDIVFYESTVYPGVTSAMISIIERISRMQSGKDFWVGYSPERVNPGDGSKTIDKISKIVAFESFPLEIKTKVLQVYSTVTSQLVLSKSLKEAETSKVIENVQRDINIAFMNEILMICEKLKINFFEVLRLAKTKWNFLDFKPGLVGGHCLPVDPYYLHDLAKKNNFDAKLILAGRNTNNEMENFVIKKINQKIKEGIKVNTILLAGISFKKNVSDIRNSLSLSIYNKLKRKKSIRVFAVDPRVKNTNKINLINFQKFKPEKYGLIVYLVNHDELHKSLKKIKKKYENKILDVFNYLQ